MAMHSIFNPALPGTFDLNGMFVGKSIYVYGVAKEDADRFAINLMCGPSNDDDIALHFNPRFNEGQIVRNTRQGGWGREEREGGFPLKAGGIFGITFTCRKNHFEIRVNRYRTFTQYDHRVPFSSITHLNIGGQCDIKVATAGIEELDIPVQILFNPPVGLAREIPFHNIRGRSLTVIGKPTSGDGRFSINFENENGNKIHFHFNPRMNERQIVRNSNDNGWGSEERALEGPFPFVDGVAFQLKIQVLRRGFDVELNGAKLLEYKKRFKALKSIKRIVVGGEVDLDKMVFT